MPSPELPTPERGPGHDHDAGKKRRNRTKTGCITCRIRRVKCDETRPSCTRCSSTGRKCDGWTNIPMSRRDLPVAIMDKKSMLLSCHQISGTGGFGEGIEHLYFDFFRQRTSQSTNKLFGCKFWSQGVLQLSHSEPAIKHAVLAISSLHQGWELYGSSSVDVDRNAMLQYSKAVEHAKTMLVKSQASSNPDRALVQKVLVACILFVCFENLMGDYESASMHLGNGLQILQDNADKGTPIGSGYGMNSVFEEEIVELLQRYDFQAMTFAQAKLPYRRAAVRFQDPAPPPLPTYFDNLSIVRRCLFEKATWAMCVVEVFLLSQHGMPQHPVKDTRTTYAEAKLEREKIISDLEQWLQQFDDFRKRESARTGTDFASTDISVWLMLYYDLAVLLVVPGCTTQEKNWDNYTVEFEHILDQCETLLEHADEKSTLSLELGVCIPLFMVAEKCRDPFVRRRAVALLDRSNRKEGIWETGPAARVCERIISVEETAARRMRGDLCRSSPGIDDEIAFAVEDDIPEEARIQALFTEVSLKDKWVKMQCMLRPKGPATPLVSLPTEHIYF